MLAAPVQTQAPIMRQLGSFAAFAEEKLLSFNQNYGCRGSGFVVPVDFYGHKPTEVKQFKTWTGFGFTVAVFLVVVASCSYVLYEYFTVSYDLAGSNIRQKGDIPLLPHRMPQMPDFGVQVSLSNDTVLDFLSHSDLMDVFFWQNYVFGDGSGGICPGMYDGQRCRKRVRIPSEKCVFVGEHGDDRKIEAFCPMWGVVQESLDEFGVLNSHFISTGSRENATVPTLQGNYLDAVYAFMEVDVHVNLTGMSSVGPAYGLDMHHIYGGAIAYVCAYHRDELFDASITDSIKKVYKRWSHSFKIKEYLTSKIDIPFTIRNISIANHVVDFDYLETRTADVIVGTVSQDLDDAQFIPSLYALQKYTNNIPVKYDASLQQYVNVAPPEMLLLSRAFLHVDETEMRIFMTPPSTIFDILGIAGGFLSLFSLVIGWPAMIINQYKYSRALKHAKKDGAIPEDYLESNGTVKVDKANEVVHHLTRRSHFPNSRSTAQLNVNALASMPIELT